VCVPTTDAPSQVSMLPPPAGHLLDPREDDEAGGAPLPGAVRIPFSQLPERTHELPPRHREVAVVGPSNLAGSVVRWLRDHDRRARLATPHEQRQAAAGPACHRLWEPTAFLQEVLPGLPPGTVLDLACGTGRDAVYLALAGWEVTAIDVLPDALARARDLEARYAPDARSVRWLCADLERDRIPVPGPFDLVTCFRFLHRPLLADIARFLRPGGHVLVETFTAAHHERYGRPRRESFVLRPGELPRLIGGLRVQHYSEGWRSWAHTARMWARRSE